MKILISHFCDNFLLHISPPPPKRKKRKIYTRKIKISPFWFWVGKQKISLEKITSFKLPDFLFFLKSKSSSSQVQYQLLICSPSVVLWFYLEPDYLIFSPTVVGLVRTRLFLFSPSVVPCTTRISIFQSKSSSSQDLERDFI